MLSCFGKPRMDQRGVGVVFVSHDDTHLTVMTNQR